MNNQLQVDADTATPGIQNSVTFPPGSGPFTVQVWVQNVTTTNCHPQYPTQPCGLGAYTLEMTFNANVIAFQSFADGPFLRSTSRSYQYCPVTTPNHKPTNGADSVISIRCTTTGSDPMGPLGSGHLATVTFVPVGIGSTVLGIGQSQLSDIAGGSICGPSPNTPCDVQNGTVIVNYKANLGVTESAPASVVAPGNVLYDIDVTNYGPDAAPDVTLVDTLPRDADFFSASPGCSYEGVELHKVTCNLGSMTASQTKNVDVTVSLTASYAGASLLNAADVSTSAYDASAANNHAEVTTQVQTSNVSITKTVPAYRNLNQQGQYVIKVTNNGPSTAASVNVADWLPSGVTYLSHSTNLGSCAFNEQLRFLSCTLNDMAPSASATITINVRFGSSPGVVCNGASVYWTRLPPGSGQSMSGAHCTRVALVDSDGDGCSDQHENGSDPHFGGQRDRLNPWDFYDVPVPTLHNGGTLNDRDWAVTVISDVLGVLQYGGTSLHGPPNTAGVDYDEDIDHDTVADGRAYDRSAAVPPHLWSNAPNGAISTIEDVLLVLGQAGHTCQGMPSPP